MLGGHIAEFVEDIILVRHRSYHPRTLGSAFAAREDGGNNLVEAILAYGSTSIFFLFLEREDEKFHLLKVENVVVEREFGIFLDSVALAAGKFFVVVERFDHVGISRFAEGIVVLLKYVAVVEVAIFFEGHGGVVALKFLHQSRKEKFRFRILCCCLDFVEIYGFNLVFLRHAGHGNHENQCG